MKIVSVVGARPNFMKIAPFIHAIESYNKSAQEKLEHILVHTGQHYDDKMSRVFFQALNIPEADVNLGIGSGSHAEQVGQTMIAFEKVIQQERPDWVVVVGDVNATCACSITAKKENVRCAHIEAGLRSRDMAMPEEVNRLVTDRLSDLLLAPDRLSVDNLRQEGVPDSQIKFVGNVMIDTLEAQREKAACLDPETIVKNNLLLDNAELPDALSRDLEQGRYALMTMHRPSNVDVLESLQGILDFLLTEVAEERTLLWPVHPRAVQRMQEFGLWDRVVESRNLVLLDPLGYHDLLRLNMTACVMLTDSGGLQEECCVLGTPCLTMRWNTERPVTLKEHGGASILVGNDIQRMRSAYADALRDGRRAERPELWDGHAAPRILQAILTAAH